MFYWPMVASLTQPMPLTPLTTMEKPRVAPTMLWVPDTGSLKNVATINQIHDPGDVIQ